jgi:hypothetical protein
MKTTERMMIRLGAGICTRVEDRLRYEVTRQVTHKIHNESWLQIYISLAESRCE